MHCLDRANSGVPARKQSIGIVGQKLWVATVAVGRLFWLIEMNTPDPRVMPRKGGSQIGALLTEPVFCRCIGGGTQRSACAVQLFGRLAIL